jgi:hypothetical protein
VLQHPLDGTCIAFLSCPRPTKMTELLANWSSSLSTMQIAFRGTDVSMKPSSPRCARLIKRGCMRPPSVAAVPVKQDHELLNNSPLGTFLPSGEPSSRAPMACSTTRRPTTVKSCGEPTWPILASTGTANSADYTLTHYRLFNVAVDAGRPSRAAFLVARSAPTSSRSLKQRRRG